MADFKIPNTYCPKCGGHLNAAAATGPEFMTQLEKISFVKIWVMCVHCACILEMNKESELKAVLPSALLNVELPDLLRLKRTIDIVKHINLKKQTKNN